MGVRIIETKNEGDIITGRCTRRIKGGLLVDVGVPVFLPASQVDIRRPNDISEFINHYQTCFAAGFLAQNTHDLLTCLFD